ncbi:MAG: hypothetical protein H6706_09560 [Myxococcales bacterium]|nr:hypothetical protein [Myxococcales bacterium]
MARPVPNLHPDAAHPGAAPDCAACDGSGWVALDEPTITVAPCACVQVCPRCGGSGRLAGGLEACACHAGAGRIDLLNAAGLPALDAPLDPPSPALSAWFQRYRPEDGWPWLLVTGPSPGPVTAQLIRLITGVGVPTARVTAHTETVDWRAWRRLVVCYDLALHGPRRAARLVDTCADHGLTLVLWSPMGLYPSAGPGLDTAIGDDAAATLLERCALA